MCARYNRGGCWVLSLYTTEYQHVFTGRNQVLITAGGIINTNYTPVGKCFRKQ